MEMENRKVLTKDVQVIENKVVITESVETRMDQSQLESKLRDIQVQKTRVRDQNIRIVEEYNKLVNDELETKDLITQLNANEGVTEI